MRKLCLLILVSVLLFACNQPAATKESGGTFSLDSVKAAINVANKTFEEAVAKGDSTAVAATYAKDACLMQSGMPKICGSAGIASFFGGAKKNGCGRCKTYHA